MLYEYIHVCNRSKASALKEGVVVIDIDEKSIGAVDVKDTKSTLATAPDTSLRRTPGESPEWVKRFSNWVMKEMWHNYDNFWVYFFGDGEGRFS